MVGAAVEAIDSERIQRGTAEAHQHQSAGLPHEARPEAHHGRADTKDREAVRDGCVTPPPQQRRQGNPGGKHHHAEHAGEDWCKAGTGVADLTEIGDDPDTNAELGEYGIHDEQPWHQHLAVAKVLERKRATALPLGNFDGQGDECEGDGEQRSEDEIGRPPRPASTQCAADDQTECHTRDARRSVDCRERFGSVLSMMVADQARHDHHQ